MSQLTEKFTRILDALSKERTNPAIDGALDWATFIIGLLPDTVDGGLVGKPAQIFNKIMNDQKLKASFEKLYDDITSINTRLNIIEEGLKRIELMRATVSNNTNLQKGLGEFIEQLKVVLQSSPTEFLLETTNWSTQEILNTLISYDSVTVASISNSSNILSKVNIESQKTNLLATDNSHNRIIDSSFKGNQGSVTMSGEHTQHGDITLSESSIGYGSNSQTEMNGWVIGTDSSGNLFFAVQPSPNKITMQCGYCNGNFDVNKQELLGLTYFQCKLCRRVALLPS